MSNSAYLTKRFYGKGRPRGQHRQGVMNSLEKWYASILDMEKYQGRILNYWFEEFKFRLADKTYYTPDFIVMNADCELEVHETKGFMQEDANVKIKCAAEKFPFKFFVIKKVKGMLEKKQVGNE
jgi:hypothetical protein